MNNRGGSKWTRRHFMKITSLTALQAITGCSPDVTAIDGRPFHHTTGGFRNYPPAPEPVMPSVSFIIRRIKGSFFDTPEVPESHVLNESYALSAFKRTFGR